MTVNFSPAQLAVINDESRALVVEAVAGSGKTTVIMGKIAHNLKTEERSQIQYLVFNKKNAIEANEKLQANGFGFPRVQANNFHSVGFRAIKKVFPKTELDNFKIRNILKSANVDYQFHSFVQDLVDKARTQAIGITSDINDRQAWMQVVLHNSLDTCFADSWGNLPSNIDDLIAEGIQIAIETLKTSNEMADRVIDFTDQLYICILKCSRALWKFDRLYVDECQDSNPLRVLMVKAMAKVTSKFVFVGDRKQAIYGFTGADNKAMDTIKSQFSARELPLAESFRCSKAAVRLAKRWFDNIEAAEGNIEGSDVTVSFRNFVDSNFDGPNFRSLRPGTDVVLCRNTKPLIEIAYFLIRNGIAAYVEGRDFGKGLVKLVKTISGTYRGEVRNHRISTFTDRAEEYKAKQIDKLMLKGKEAQAATLDDQIETLFVLADMCSDVNCLISKINSIFGEQDDKENKNKIRLMTIHKSKGLEFERVYWLGLNRYQPSPFARQEWMLEQEFHLCYVAATRSKDAIIQIEVPYKKGGLFDQD